MKVKTSLTLSEDVLDALDKMAGKNASRSALIDTILRDYIEGRARERREARDAAALNKLASRLNAEMDDVLALQGDPPSK